MVAVRLKRGGARLWGSKKDMKNGPPLEASLEQLSAPLVAIVSQKPSNKAAKRKSKRCLTRTKNKTQDEFLKMWF